MKDLMLDLETMGNSSTSVIVQIGACYFNRKTGEIGNTFSQNVSIDSCLGLGLTVNGSTIQWWMKQENKSWMDNPQGIHESLWNFQTFINVKPNCVWSHASFDVPILFNAYTKAEISIPFHYRCVKDLRTLTNLAKMKKKENPDIRKTHNALDDCIYQVEYTVECLNIMKGN